MTNRENYKRAFSSLHTSECFSCRLEETMKVKSSLIEWRRALAAAGILLAVMVGGSTAYAANVGGIQRAIQIWLHGDQTEAVLTVDETAGTYTITDKNGTMIEGGGGVSIDADGKERPLTAEEITQDLANRVTTDTIDGRMYLLYHSQKFDITDKFADSDYYFVTLKDSDTTLYVTVSKDGAVASSPDRYPQPGKDFSNDAVAK